MYNLNVPPIKGTLSFHIFIIFLVHVKVLVVSNLNLLLAIVLTYTLVRPIMMEIAHDPYYVPSTIAFYGYMLVAILSHDILFYHGHR